MVGVGVIGCGSAHHEIYELRTSEPPGKGVKPNSCASNPEAVTVKLTSATNAAASGDKSGAGFRVNNNLVGFIKDIRGGVEYVYQPSAWGHEGDANMCTTTRMDLKHHCSLAVSAIRPPRSRNIRMRKVRKEENRRIPPDWPRGRHAATIRR